MCLKAKKACAFMVDRVGWLPELDCNDLTPDRELYNELFNGRRPFFVNDSICSVSFGSFLADFVMFSLRPW
jgi:hypothetical protein